MHKENSNTLFVAWLICSVAAVYYSYEYFLRISPSVMEHALREHFNLSATGFGFLSAFYYYAYVPMQLPVGVLLDRYGPRRMLPLACFACVLGTFLFAGTSIFWIAAIGRFLVGFGSAFAFVGVLKLATIWLPEDKLAMVAGLTSALGTIGAMIGDNALGSLVMRVGWRETVNLSAYFGLVLTVLLWFGIREKNSFFASDKPIDTFKKSMGDLGSILRNKQIWINGLFGCLVYLPATVFAELWGIPYLQHTHELSQSDANLANSLLFLGFTIGAPLTGYLSDKLMRRKLPMFLGAIATAIVMIIILYVPHLKASQINGLMILLGFFYSVECIVFAVARELSPQKSAGTAMAITNMIVMLGAMLLQPLVGHLLDFSYASRQVFQDLSTTTLRPIYTSGDYQFAMSITSVGIVIGAILVLFLKETGVSLASPAAQVGIDEVDPVNLPSSRSFTAPLLKE